MLNKHLFKNSLYTGAALCFVGFVPFIFNILVARIFGKETLGTINVALSFCLVLTVFVTNFFGTSGNKFLAEYRGRKSLEPFKLVFFTILIGPVVVLTFLNAAMVWHWDYIVLRFSVQPNFLVPMVSYIYFRSFYIIFRRMFYGIDLVPFYAINEIVSDIILIAAIGAVCWLRLPHLLIQSYVLGYSIFTVISILALYKNYAAIVGPLHPQENYQTKSVLIDYFKYGFITMVGTASSTGTGYLSMLFTGYFLTSTDAGLYSSVLAIVSIVMFLPRLVTQVLLPEFSKLFGEPVRNSKKDLLTQFHMDIASSIQLVTEEIVLRLTRSIAKDNESKNLCMAGGVALNCVANGKIIKEKIFDNIWIQPAAGDAGGALGAALAIWHKELKQERSKPIKDNMCGSYLGPSFNNDEILDKLTALGATFEKLSEEDLLEITAKELSKEKTIIY